MDRDFLGLSGGPPPPPGTTMAPGGGVGSQNDFYNGSKIRIGSSNLDQSDGRGPPVRSIKVLAPVSKFRPVVGRFDCREVEALDLQFLAGCCLN